MERKAEHGSFSLIILYWMLFKVAECFTLRAFNPYLKKNSLIELPLFYFRNPIVTLAWKYSLYISPFTFIISPLPRGSLLPRPFPDQDLSTEHLG